MNSNTKHIGIVIVDGVGFKNFVLSDVLIQLNAQFKQVTIFSGLPKTCFEGFNVDNCTIEELEDFREPSKTWFFRKLKEVAHLQNHKKNNFGIRDNLRGNYPKSNSKRGILTKLIFAWTYFFHSENWINIYNRCQQKTFKNNVTTKRYIALLKTHSPDIVYFTHQRPPYIAPLIYASEQTQTNTATFIFSWDNLPSKGRMAANFDCYLVWSDLMKKELLQFYPNVKDSNIAVVGTPQFEPYVLERYNISRENFEKK